MLDVSILLAPVSADAPSGEDLEYDASYLELERSAQGQPERQMGDAVIAAEPPEWRSVREMACQLCSRTKDLRVANYLVQSSIALDGLPGFAQALGLVRDLLAQFWDDLHPQLDADDDNDPTFRINALAGLNAEIIQRLLREAELIRSRAFGPVSVRAALNASGLLSFASETLSGEQLSGAFRDCDDERVEALRATLNEILGTLGEIETLVSSRVGSRQGVDLQPLAQVIKQMLLVMSEHAPSSSVSQSADMNESDEQQDSSFPAASVPRMSGEVRSRDDVLRALDRIIEYYARHEPSSPLPVLLGRARGLVDADFATIVRNLIPDGVSQFENLRGPDSY